MQSGRSCPSPVRSAQSPAEGYGRGSVPSSAQARPIQAVQWLTPSRPGKRQASSWGQKAGAVIAEPLSAVASAGQRAARVAAEAMRLLTDIGAERKRRMVWSQSGHAAIEVRGLPGRGRAHRAMSGTLRSALRDVRGVRWAEVNAVTAQALIAFDEDEVSVGELVDAVASVEEAHGTAGDGFSWQREVHPADSAPLSAA